MCRCGIAGGFLKSDQLKDHPATHKNFQMLLYDFFLLLSILSVCVGIFS